MDNAFEQAMARLGRDLRNKVIDEGVEVNRRLLRHLARKVRLSGDLTDELVFDAVSDLASELIDEIRADPEYTWMHNALTNEAGSYLAQQVLINAMYQEYSLLSKYSQTRGQLHKLKELGGI